MKKLLATAVLLTATVAIAPPAAGQSNRVGFQPADSWLGKWSGAASYSQTTQVWDWWFEVSRPCDDYLIQTHTSGPELTEVLNISATELEFLFHDKPGTHITIVRQGNDVYSGTVSQPNNKVLPHGRVDGRRIGEAAAVPAAGSQCSDAEPQAELVVEMAPLQDDGGGFDLRTGEPADSIVTVTNSGAARLFEPRLELALSGKALSESADIEASPAEPRQDAEAAFFEIKCGTMREGLRCPLGYADEVEGGRTYLDPGESRSIYLRATPWEPGELSVTATASAQRDDSSEVTATTAQSVDFIGPLLGLRLVGTTPAPYGYSDNPRLPLHEGREITLRYAILNSQAGGAARDVELYFFTRTGEVVSVALASGEVLPCGRPKPTDRQVADCVIAGLAPGESAEVDAAFRYGRRFMVETDLRAGESRQEHAYETWMDLDPAMTVGHAPQPSTTVAEGQEIAAYFVIANRGRGSVAGAVLNLSTKGGDAGGFAIETVEGCASVNLVSGVTACALAEFSKEAPAEIGVVTTPVPAGAEGSTLGLVWEMEVPGHRFPYHSTANEKGYAQYSVGKRIADLYVAEYLPADDLEPGVPQIFQLEIGNKGTWPQEDAVLDLRLDLTDDGGAAAPGSYLTRASALLSNPDKPTDVVEVPCEVSGNAARCALGTLPPHSAESIMFEMNSGDLAEGRYRYEARISEGQGEAGDATRTRNNVVSGGAEIFPTGETLADLRVFKALSDKDAWAQGVQGFDFWVENIGTLGQDNVVVKLEFAVEPEEATPSGLRFLSDVTAVIPNLGGADRPARRVPCVTAVGTASCALGRIETEDLAHVFVEWQAYGITGRYRYAAHVGEAAGEAASNALGDNTIQGGGAIKPVGTAEVIPLEPTGSIEYPAHGDDVTPDSSALGTFQDLPPDYELWYFSFSPKPQWYYLRPVERDPGASGLWAIHHLTHGRRGRADIGYIYRIGILAADPAANASLLKNAARLRDFPAGSTVLHQIEVKRVGE